MDAAAALGEGLAHHGAGQIGRCLPPAACSAPTAEQGTQQPLPQRPFAGEHLVDRAGRAGAASGSRARDTRRARLRDAPTGIEEPPRNEPVIGAQRPALACFATSKKAKGRRARAGQPVLRADGREISGGPPDCRRGRGGCRCRSSCRAGGRGRSGSARRPAAPPSDQLDPRALRGQRHRGRQARQSGADHMTCGSSQQACIARRSTEGAAWRCVRDGAAAPSPAPACPSGSAR